MSERRLTHTEWLAEAKQRFGSQSGKWRFVCPSCKVETTVDEWQAAGAPEGAVAFSCIGRFTGGEGTMDQGKAPKQPCNYTGGGLFKLNPVEVTDDGGVKHMLFEFAEGGAS